MVVSTGTLNIALKYDSGVIILCDRQVTAGDRVFGDVLKIETLSANIGLTYTGIVGDCQATYKRIAEYLNEMSTTVAEKFLNDSVSELEKQTENTEKKEAIAAFRNETTLAEKLDTLMGQGKYPFLTVRDAGKRYEVKMKKQLPVSYSYPRENKIIHYEGEIIFLYVGSGTIIPLVESAAHFMADYMRTESERTTNKINAGFIIGGCDILYGPQIFEVEPIGSVLEGKNYLTSGNGGGFAQDVLDVAYRENMILEDALKLAVFTAINASKRIDGVNNRLDALIISMDDKKIRQEFVTKEEISVLRELLAEKKVTLPSLL